VGAWISDRTQEEVVASFEEAGAAVAPIYDIEGIMQDPQFEALNSIITVEDPELGPTKMQNVLFRLSETPGEVKWSGSTLGAHNKEVYGELGIGREELDELSEKGIV
jgi:crotonobetainyl-CoA:carnitine CoA-transferase CaiB-like acyl-CoA transferase